MMDEISVSMLLFLIMIGFLAAFVDYVVGGGGMISVPALLATGIPPAVALGTNKLASTMGSFTSTLSFFGSGKVHKRLVLRLVPLSFIGSIFGGIVVQIISSEMLKPVIIVLLVAVTVYTLFLKNWGTKSTFRRLTKKTMLFLIGMAIMIGFYDGFLGPGTGSFLIILFFDDWI